MLRNIVSSLTLAVSLFVFGVSRQGFLEQDQAVIGGDIPNCNVRYYESQECHGDGCPEDFKDYYYTYWTSENLFVTQTTLCSHYTNAQNQPCAGDAQHDSVSGNCTEFWWDWL